MFQERVRSIQTVLFAVVEQEDGCPTGPALWHGEIFDHLQQCHNGHAVVCGTRGCRHRVIVGREDDTLRADCRRLGTVYLHQYIRAFEIDASVTSIGGVRLQIVGQMNIVL